MTKWDQSVGTGNFQLWRLKECREPGWGAGSCGSLNSSAKQQEAYSPRAMALWHSQKQDGRYLSYSGQSLAGIGISPSTPWWKASGARVPKSSSSWKAKCFTNPCTLRPISMGVDSRDVLFFRKGIKRLTQKPWLTELQKRTNYIHLFRHHFLVPRFTYPCSCPSAVLRATLVRPLLHFLHPFRSGFDLLCLAVPTASNKHPSRRIA